MTIKLIAAASVSALTLAGCQSLDGLDTGQNFVADLYEVTVYPENVGIHSPDGTEQMLFRFVPTKPRSLEERAVLAAVAMESHGECFWEETSMDVLEAMSQTDPMVQAGYNFLGLVRC